MVKSSPKSSFECTLPGFKLTATRHGCLFIMAIFSCLVVKFAHKEYSGRHVVSWKQPQEEQRRFSQTRRGSAFRRSLIRDTSSHFWHASLVAEMDLCGGGSRVAARRGDCIWRVKHRFEQSKWSGRLGMKLSSLSILRHNLQNIYVQVRVPLLLKELVSPCD